MSNALHELRMQLRPASWSEEREERVLAAMQRRRRNNALSNVALGSALAAVSLSLAIMWLAKSDAPTPDRRATLSQPAATDDSVSSPNQLVVARSDLDQAIRPEAPRPAIRLDDGGRVLALGNSQVRLVAQTQTEASFQLVSGKAWFDLEPSTSRNVIVRIADVRVQVLGSEFVVERKGDEVFVWVQRGSAIVSSKGTEITLHENENGSFPAHDLPTANLPTLPEPASQALASNESRAKTNAAKSLKPKSVVALWSIADSARLDGDIGPAINALDALVTEYPQDARAALAAFTLGRILLDSRKNPRRAAAAFEKARTLAPKAPLVEDALAREIEARWLANDGAVAKQRTNLYERLFPNGRHIERNRKRR